MKDALLFAVGFLAGWLAAEVIAFRRKRKIVRLNYSVGLAQPKQPIGGK